MYKIDQVLVIAHGVGTPSMLIALNEISKLIVHAGCTDVTFLRVSPSGGIGLNIGDVVISNEAVDYKFEAIFETIDCGEINHHSTKLNLDIYHEILSLNYQANNFKITTGKTIGSDDYYEGQARFNGALPPPYTINDQKQYLNNAMQHDVKNFDLEANGFAGFCNQLGIKACSINAIYTDRLKSDIVSASTKQKEQALKNAQAVATNYIIYKLLQMKDNNDN